MDTYFSSINDCSFWKTDLFCGENDMGSYENSVYPRIFSADSYRTGDGRTYVYCTADPFDCGNYHLVFPHRILKFYGPSYFLGNMAAFLLTCLATISIINLFIYE